ncbi:MAG: response regulator [Pseudomonadota bacterium]
MLQDNSATSVEGQEHSDLQLLVVDDDAALRKLLKRYLSEHGYRVEAVADGAAMRRFLAGETADLVILDLMLPGESGLELAKALRRQGNLPIIILSAHGEEVDRIVGLELGADDYLPKPFNPRELLARIRAVLRRTKALTAEAKTAGDQAEIYHFGAFSLNRNARKLNLHGRAVHLTSGEFTLLVIFVNHPNRVLSRDSLLQLLKGYEHQPYDRSIDVRVTRLRRKLEQDPANPQHIRTIWGEGYLFCPDPEET